MIVPLVFSNRMILTQDTEQWACSYQDYMKCLSGSIIWFGAWNSIIVTKSCFLLIHYFLFSLHTGFGHEDFPLPLNNASVDMKYRILSRTGNVFYIGGRGIFYRIDPYNTNPECQVVVSMWLIHFKSIHPCGILRQSFPQGECNVQIDKFIQKFYLESFKFGQW